MVIRDQFATGPRAVIFRRALLSFQFFSTTLLIIVSLAMFQQLQLIQNTPLGFSKERVLVFHSNNREVYRNRAKIKDKLTKIPGIKSVSLMYGGIPGSAHPLITYQVDGKDKFQWYTALIDENFHSLLGLSYLVVDSAWLSNSLVHDRIILLNEKAVNSLGWTIASALGKSVEVLEKGIPSDRKVVGVLKNYHFQSLKYNLEPLALIPMVDWAETFAVKLSSENLTKTIADVEQVWTSTAPDFPFVYHFLESSFDKLYERETNHLNLFVLFTIISVILSCLGLLGISGLLVQQRRKELGVRSVLGASLINIVGILSKEFIVIVIISGLLAYPSAYFINNNWIDSFATQINNNPLNYIFASIFLSLLIFLIVFIQSVRSGISNPVKNLRSE